MRHLVHADGPRPGLVLAWRRWLLGLAGLGVILCLVTTGADLESPAGGEEGPSALIGPEDHEAPVWSLAFADSSRLASATLAGEIRVKDLVTGRTLRLRVGAESYALSLAFSRGGRILAVGGNRPAVRFWEVETGIEQEPLRDGTGAVRSVAFSPDGSRLAVGTCETPRERPIVTLWEWPDRRPLAYLRSHRGHINGLAFSPDGSRLVTADSAGQVKLWDVGMGTERVSWQAHEAGIRALAFSPDAHLFATTSYVDGEVRLWDAADGGPRGSLRVSASVAGLAFSPDGTTLAMARGDGVVSLCDTASGREIGMVGIPTGSLQAVALSGDGRWLATGGGDGTVRLWDVVPVLDGKSHGP